MSLHPTRFYVLAAACAGLAVVLALSPRPAQACSCNWPDLGNALAEADAVFAGTGGTYTTPFGPFAQGVAVAVDTVWKGNVPDPVFIVAGEHDPDEGEISVDSCQETPRTGDRTLFFATQRDGYFETWTCSGTEAWYDGNVPGLFEPLVARLGPGSLPDPAAPTHAPPAGVLGAPLSIEQPQATVTAERVDVAPTPPVVADEQGAVGVVGDENAEDDLARVPWTPAIGIGFLIALAAFVLRRRMR